MKSEVKFHQLKKYWITGKKFELNGEKVTVKVVGLYVDTDKMWSFELSNGEILYRKKPICLCCEKTYQRKGHGFVQFVTIHSKGMAGTVLTAIGVLNMKT